MVLLKLAGFGTFAVIPPGALHCATPPVTVSRSSTEISPVFGVDLDTIGVSFSLMMMVSRI